MKLVNTKIQLNSALILVGLVFFVPSPRQADYSIVFKSSLYLVPHSQAIGKELNREMELDFCTPLFHFSHGSG